MRKFFSKLFLGLLLLASVPAFSTTYYVSAAGNDSQAGTTKTTPWLHAPGMNACTGTCASTTINPGDSVIFRGGDTWHFGNSGATPYVGACTISGTICWAWTFSGSSGNPIYIGVDETWFSGSGWVRPVMSGDNPLSTAFVSSCTYDQSNTQFLKISGTSYVTLDNFDWQEACIAQTSVSGAYVFNYQTDHAIISNHYFHGQTAVVTAQDNFASILGNHAGSTGLVTNNQIVNNAFDYSDSSQGAGGSSACSAGFAPTYPCYMGLGVYSEGYDIHHNYFGHMSNMIVVNNGSTIHDNTFEYIYTSFSPSSIAPHSNVLNEYGNIASAPTYFYNNLVRHTYVTQVMYLTVGTAAYVFDNVIYDTLRYGTSGGSTAPTNCIIMGTVANTGSEVLYFYNNTISYYLGTTGGGCNLTYSAANGANQAWNGTTYYANNHLIDIPGAVLSGFYHVNSGASNTPHDLGSEIFQTETVANGQGYTVANNYGPTLASNSTVGAGLNEAGSCSTFSTDSALCSGTSNGTLEIGSNGGLAALYPAITVLARPTAWDSGAYQFAPLLTLVVSGVGNVNSSPSGFATSTFGQYTANFQPNASVTLTGSPATGHTQGNWSGAGCSANPCNLTITTATTVYASFPPNYTGGYVGGISTIPITQPASGYAALGGTTGAGTCFIPADFFYVVCRLTDESWDPTLPSSYYTTINSDAPHYMSPTIQTGTGLFAFSGPNYVYVGQLSVAPTTGDASLSHVYPCGTDSAHGGWYAPFATEGGFTWNTNYPDVLYLKDSGGIPSFSSYDFTGYSANPCSSPVVNQKYNFTDGTAGPWGITSQNCLPSKPTYSSNNWHSLDSPSRIPADACFELALSYPIQVPAGVDTLTIVNGSTTGTISGSQPLDTTGTLTNALTIVNGQFGKYAIASVASGGMSVTFTTAFSGTACASSCSFSVPVEQGTGEDVLVYCSVGTPTLPQGCTHLNTGSGVVTSDNGYNGVVTGSSDRFTLHGSRLDPDGAGLFMSTDNGIPGVTSTVSPMGYHYNLITGQMNNLCVSPNTCGGHQVSGYKNILNNGGTFPQTEIRPYASNPSFTELTDNPPIPFTNCTVPNPIDTHGNWNGGDAADTYPSFWTSEWLSTSAQPPGGYTCPLENTVYAPAENGTIYVFAFNGTTGQSTNYPIENVLHQMCDDGSCDIWTSDWYSLLGTNRGDLFYVGNLLAPLAYSGPYINGGPKIKGGVLIK
jgi:hypothetical protein